jgi:uncharacterized membrane protein YozB (DUF420 family)
MYSCMKCVCVYVCMYARMHICVYVSVYKCTYVRKLYMYVLCMHDGCTYVFEMLAISLIIMNAAKKIRCHTDFL